MRTSLAAIARPAAIARRAALPRRAVGPRLAAVAVGIALVVAGCAGMTGAPEATPRDPVAELAPAVEPLSLELLLANGQTPTGPTTQAAVAVGNPRELPWALYLEVSKQAGLDFTAAVGREATLYRTPIKGWTPEAAAFVLVIDGTVGGAWIDPGGSSSGVLPVNAIP